MQFPANPIGILVKPFPHLWDDLKRVDGPFVRLGDFLQLLTIDEEAILIGVTVLEIREFNHLVNVIG